MWSVHRSCSKSTAGPTACRSSRPLVELVEKFIVASGLTPDEVVVDLREQSRTVTVEQIAVNAVAAGCRPEYLPVVVTALRAMNEEQYNLHSTTVSGATAPLVIVSGDAIDLLGIKLPSVCSARAT